jgi:hypothetical protein
MQKGTVASNPKMHPVLVVLSRVPLKLRYSMMLVGIVTYVVFILLTLLTGQAVQILLSFMHLVQLDFSLLITIGLFFLQSYYRTLDKTLREIRYVFLIEASFWECLSLS